jgi:hypothetical protein
MAKLNQNNPAEVRIYSKKRGVFLGTGKVISTNNRNSAVLEITYKDDLENEFSNHHTVSNGTSRLGINDFELKGIQINADGTVNVN